MQYDRPDYGRPAFDKSTWELIERIRTFKTRCADTELRFEAQFLMNRLAFMEVSLASALEALAQLEEQAKDQS